MKHAGLTQVIFDAPSLADTHYSTRLREATLDAVADVRSAVDGMMVVARACEEEPHAWEHPYMKRLVGAISLHGMELINGRDLWARTHDDQLGFLAAGDPCHYVRALTVLDEEHKKLGTKRTVLYAEPHDRDDGGRRFFSDKKNGWKKTGFTRADEWRVQQAIFGARHLAPRATIVDPGFTLWEPGGKEHYAHTFRLLGEMAAHRDTFRVRNPADYTPPDLAAVACCGFWVALDPTADDFVADYGTGVLSCEEYMAMDWAAWLARFPNLDVVYIYTHMEETAEVMLRLGELAA